jgi:hypothetical protein
MMYAIMAFSHMFHHVNTKILHTESTDNTVLDGRKAVTPARCQAIRLESRLKTDPRKIRVDIPSRFLLPQTKTGHKHVMVNEGQKKQESSPLFYNLPKHLKACRVIGRLQQFYYHICP